MGPHGENICDALNYQRGLGGSSGLGSAARQRQQGEWVHVAENSLAGAEQAYNALDRPAPFETPWNVIAMLGMAFPPVVDGTTEQRALNAIAEHVQQAMREMSDAIGIRDGTIRSMGMSLCDVRSDLSRTRQSHGQREHEWQIKTNQYMERMEQLAFALTDLHERLDAADGTAPGDFEALFRSKLVDLGLLPEPEQPVDESVEVAPARVTGVDAV